MDEKMLEKHMINHHLKKKCCFCAKKLLKKEVEEHMDTVHKKVPVKSVEYKIGPKGKTDAKTTMEWGDRDDNLVDSTQKNRKLTTLIKELIIKKILRIKILMLWKRVMKNIYQVQMRKMLY